MNTLLQQGHRRFAASPNQLGGLASTSLVYRLSSTSCLCLSRIRPRSTAWEDFAALPVDSIHLLRSSTRSELQLKNRSYSNYAPHTNSDFPASNSQIHTSSLKSESNAASMRISKLLSNYAVNLSISRRQAEKLVQTGRVTVAGEVIRNSASLVNIEEIRKHPSAYIKVKGKAIQIDIFDQKDGSSIFTPSTSSNVASATPKVWAVHKLNGEVVCENDPQGRPSLMDRLRRGGVGRDFKGGNSNRERQWHLKPIGRLDIPTEGLILVTNNGVFAREMELPKTAIHRVYRVRVHGRLTSNKLDRIRNGGVRYENVKYGPMKVAVERRRKDTYSSTNTWLQVTCTEGKNRQIRNVFAALGMTVTRLIRISYGDYHLDTIPKGMAIPVPYKPVAKQRAKGTIADRRTSILNRERAKKLDQISPVKWANGLQSRRMSTLSQNSSSLDGQLASRQALQDEVLSLFPQEQIVYSFGYGSGIFSQTLKDAKHKHEGMIDLILVVDDTRRFHEANMEVFPRHYAPWLRYGGPSLAYKVQRQFPLSDAHVLFHVVDDPVPMKYGVVAQEDFVRDLTEWETLYLSGRLHKPTLGLVDPLPGWFETAQHQNLTSAVSVALLFMAAGPNDASWAAFFQSIASLSYTGDFRMQLGGEDPQKLIKLVHAPGQLERFQAMYKRVLENFEREGIISCNFVEVDDGDFCEKGIFMNGHSREYLAYIQSHLPACLKRQLSPSYDTDEVVAALSAALTATVAPAARHQSLKGIATLGLHKSLHYASAKLSKGLFAAWT